MARARERALGGADAPGVRPVVLESWRRARRDGVDPERSLPPVPIPEDEVHERRAEHPLAAVWPTLAHTLRSAIAEPGHVVFLSDERGHLLWVDGDRKVRRRAEEAHLVPGALWSERAVGTCGVGTALALRRPVRVAGAEHYLDLATPFVCSAAPIRDSEGNRLGAIDITTGVAEARTDTLATVTVAARLAESVLREHARRRALAVASRYVDRLSRRSGVKSALVLPDGRVIRRHPDRWLPRRVGTLREGAMVLADGRPVTVERLGPDGPFLVVAGEPPDEVAFAALGRDRALLRIGDVDHELSRRHGELMVLLLASPGGLSGGELARALYGPHGKAVTVRAELARLRRILGYRLAADPYRIVGPVRADFLDAPESGHYPGPLLPRSRAPGVVALREELDARMQRCCNTRR